MDEFVLSLFFKVYEVINSGIFVDEIVFVIVFFCKGDIVVDIDEGLGFVCLEKILILRLVFKKDGMVMVVNLSLIFDGVVVLVVMSESKVNEFGLVLFVCVVVYVINFIEFENFIVVFVGVMEKVLDKVGWMKEEVDFFEINEVFVMVIMLVVKKFGLDESKVNVKGGVCVLGYLIGVFGVCILVILFYVFK